MTAAVERCGGTFGRLDVLVNNAGIHFARAIDEYADEEIDRLLSVNLKGALHAIRSALPLLRRARGSIVSVSSMTGLVGQDRGAVYVATKGALIALTKALALELAPDGIRVNCVCPAGVDTPLMRTWAETLPDPQAVLRGPGGDAPAEQAGIAGRDRRGDHISRLARRVVHHRRVIAGGRRCDARVSAGLVATRGRPKPDETPSALL